MDRLRVRRGGNYWFPELKTRGHDCICVDLPTDQPDSSATAYASVIGKAIEKSTNPIVVAHSASGLFLPLIPEYASVARLIYLAAVIPVPGEEFPLSVPTGSGNVPT